MVQSTLGEGGGGGMILELERELCNLGAPSLGQTPPRSPSPPFTQEQKKRGESVLVSAPHFSEWGRQGLMGFVTLQLSKEGFGIKSCRLQR